MRLIHKPKEGQYPPSAAAYIALLPDDGKVLSYLKDNLHLTRDFMFSIPLHKLTKRYAKGKWTIKEVLGHVTDDERIYGYRALRIARADKTELPGFEPEDYVLFSNANNREIADLINEYTSVRLATLSLFESLDENALSTVGVVNGYEVSVSAAIYHIAGHELHHVNIIRQRYL